jgi:hypothetical protein
MIVTFITKDTLWTMFPPVIGQLDGAKYGRCLSHGNGFLTFLIRCNNFLTFLP